MTKIQRDIASFVLRFTQDLWQDAQGEPHVEWRGHIRHIQGDEEVRFTDFSEAVTFIQRYLMQLTLGTLAALPEGDQMDQEKTLHESFKLWEKFASSYTDMMFDAVEQTIKQSEAFKKQMDEAVTESLKAWKPPAQAESGQIIEMLQALQAQVQTLGDKVDSLEKSLKK
jgi:hypothetical protein